jgi:hypothetical protein
MCGGVDGSPKPARVAMKKPSMEDHLRNFRMGLKRVVSETMDFSDTEYMKPNADKKSRLRGLGISTHMPMVNMRVLITEEAKCELANNIIASQRRCTGKELKEIWHHTRKIGFGKYNGKGRSAWATGIKIMKSEVFRGEGKEATLQQWEDDVKKMQEEMEVAKTKQKIGDEALGTCTSMQNLDPPDLGQSSKHTCSFSGAEIRDFSHKPTYVCSACGEEANAHRKGFDLKDLGLSIMCYNCKKTRKSKEWLCQCKRIWYSCETHKGAAEQARANKKQEKTRTQDAKAKKTKKTATLKQKTKRRPAEQMVSFTRSELRAVETREVKKNLLSKVLQKRFSHLCKEEV